VKLQRIKRASVGTEMMMAVAIVVVLGVLTHYGRLVRLSFAPD